LKSRIVSISPSNRAHLLVLLGAILLGSYILGLTGWRTAVLGGLLLGLPPAMIVLTLYTVASGSGGLRVERIVAGKPVEGYYTPVILRVKAGTILAPLLYTIIDTPPPDIETMETPGSPGVLLPGSTGEGLYYVKPRIGRRRFGPARLVLSDLLGTVKVILEVTPEGFNSLTGYPSRALTFEAPELKPVADPYAAPSTHLIRGQGTEFYSIREFVEGDEPRLIDWKATARTGKLYVKELRRESEMPLLIVFTASGEAGKGEPYRTAFETLARAVYVLARIMAERGSSIGYIALTGETPVEVPPVKGREATPRLADGIALTPPPGGEAPYNLSEPIVYARRYIASRGIAVLVGDAAGLRRASRTARALSLMGHRVYALTISNGRVVLAPYSQTTIGGSGRVAEA